LDTAVSLMRGAKTRTGLRTTVAVIKRVFETGRTATQDMKDNLTIVYDDLLPKWNYVANPRT
ncbi:MAG: ISAzo13 family transposase, partial [bacterium]|nr:ISAzo13 family transposase [bacterium]